MTIEPRPAQARDRRDRARRGGRADRIEATGESHDVLAMIAGSAT
jgi:hypothetical protein